MLNNKGVVDKNNMNKKELIINFSIIYVATNYTRSPFGMITINDLNLLNLNNFFSDIDMSDSEGLYLVFKMNGNKNKTLHAKLNKNLPL